MRGWGRKKWKPRRRLVFIKVILSAATACADKEQYIIS
jgi:hypothetical protein